MLYLLVCCVFCIPPDNRLPMVPRGVEGYLSSQSVICTRESNDHLPHQGVPRKANGNSIQTRVEKGGEGKRMGMPPFVSISVCSAMWVLQLIGPLPTKDTSFALDRTFEEIGEWTLKESREPSCLLRVRVVQITRLLPRALSLVDNKLFGVVVVCTIVARFGGSAWLKVGALRTGTVRSQVKRSVNGLGKYSCSNEGGQDHYSCYDQYLCFIPPAFVCSGVLEQGGTPFFFLCSLAWCAEHCEKNALPSGFSLYVRYILLNRRELDGGVVITYAGVIGWD